MFLSRSNTAILATHRTSLFRGSLAIDSNRLVHHFHTSPLLSHGRRSGAPIGSIKRKKILVHGSSVEGITTVLSMHRAMENSKSGDGKKAIEVEIVDTAGSQQRGGALICNPNVMRVFDRLGILDDVVQRGHILGHYTVCNSRGQSWVAQDLGGKSEKEFEGIPFVSIEQDALLSVLMRAAERTGIAKFASSSDSTLINYDDKNKRITTSMRTLMIRRHYDLLIGADGVDSPIRNSFFAGVGSENIGTGKPGVPLRIDTSVALPREFTPQNNMYQCAGIVMDCPSDLDYQDQCFEWTVMQHRMGVVPLPNNRIFVFGIFYQGGEMTSLASSSGGQVANMFVKVFRGVRGLGGDMILSVLSRIGRTAMPDPSMESYTENMRSLVLNNAVHDSGQMVLVGGAAHAVDNSLWQQVTVDAEDGYLLGTHLGNALATGEDANIASALEQYNKSSVLRATDLNLIGSLYTKSCYRGFFHHDFMKTLKMVTGKRLLVKRRMNQALRKTNLP